MKKSVFILTFLFLFGSISLAQRAKRLSEEDALVFGNGFHTITTSNAMFFNAFDKTHGWQIFRFDGNQVKQVSNFQHILKVKNNVYEHSAGGGEVNWMLVFNDVPVFHVSGKTIDKGLYRMDGDNLVKLLGEVGICSEGFVLNNQLIITEITPKKKNVLRRIITITKDWKISKSNNMHFNTSAIPTREPVVIGSEVYGIGNGHLKKWTKNGFVKILPQFTHVQSTFVIRNSLFFSALEKDSPEMHLFSLQDDESIVNHGNIFPGKNMITVQKPLVDDDYAYFVADPDGNALVLYKISTNKLDTLAILTGNHAHRVVQGLDICLGQVFIGACGVNDEHFELMQFDGKSVSVTHPGRLTDVVGSVVFKDHLVYLGSDMGRESLFTSDPVLPPVLKSDTFNIFDFFKSGKTVGQVSAFDVTNRLKYKIIDGNVDSIFEINYFDGEIQIANSEGIRNKADSNIILMIEVTNKAGVSATAPYTIHISKGKSMNTSNLHESLMFFPDFTKKSTLTTQAFPDGQIIGIYDIDFLLIDELRVRNKTIVLGPYEPGIYFLNTFTDKNLYQKIELH